MQYKRLGNTALNVSKICHGTMAFGSQGTGQQTDHIDQPAATRLVAKALENGINFFDTDNVYANGDAERMLGRALKEIGVPREKVVITTKVRGSSRGPDAKGTPRERVENTLKQSLIRLDTDYIDLYQVRDDLLNPLEETLQALNNLVSSGMVHAIGCFDTLTPNITEALAMSAARNWARFESVQAYYSVASRDLEKGLINLIEAENIGLLVWSPMAGEIFSEQTDHPIGLFNEARRWTDHTRASKILEVIRPIAQAHGCPAGRVAQAWLLQQEEVASVIANIHNLEELEDNLAAAELKLTESEISAINAVCSLKENASRFISGEV